MNTIPEINTASPDNTPPNKKTVLITGANSGIGKATAIAIAKTGATVVMLCRDRERGESACREVQQQSQNSNVDMMLCDLASLQSIMQFIKLFREKYRKLDVLINNAGVITPGYQKTADGLELQFGVNHLGHFLLTIKLLDILKASAPARIVIVSSGAHKIGKIQFDDINLHKRYSFWRAYAQSKLANVLFCFELARILEGSGVTANCLHPGAVASNMGIDRSTGFGKTITGILKPFFLTSSQGAITSVHLALSPETAQVTGTYFYKQKPAKPSRLAKDPETARKLWELSTKLLAEYL